MSFAKRWLDLAGSMAGILVLLPMFLVIGLAIWLEDRGPVFFKQKRVGFNGREFRILKFRTMSVDAERKGGQLTVGRDPRITRTGNWLRKTKLDELPQLVNVLLGEMSLVGPRPEVPRYVGLYTEEQRAVLRLTPGMTDLASVHFRNESDLLACAVDPERTYVAEIMPAKIRLNLEYAAHANVYTDIKIILRTIGVMFR